MSSPNLTAKQTRWVHEYLACGNATASAIKAGFSARGASVAGNRMLRNASVQKALQARQSADATRLLVTRESVLNRLLEAFEIAKSDRNPGAMVAATKQIGLMLGLYQPEVKKFEIAQVESADMWRIQSMSDEELMAIIKGSNGQSN